MNTPELIPGGPEGRMGKTLGKIKTGDLSRAYNHVQSIVNDATTDASYREKCEGLLELIKLAQHLQQGRLRMENAVAAYDDLKKGRLVLTSADIGSGDVETLLELLFNMIEAAKEKGKEDDTKTAAAAKADRDDKKAESAAKVDEGKQIDKIAEGLLLKEVGKTSEGLSLAILPVSAELAKSRTDNKTGFQTITGKNYQPLTTTTDEIHAITRSFVATDIHSHLKRAGANAAVTIEPIEKRTPIYEAPAAESAGMWQKLFGGEPPKPKKIGENVEAFPFKFFNEKAAGTEQAYRLSLIVIDTEGAPYIDPTTKRHGCAFDGSIVLPKSLAEKALETIRKNPGFAKELFTKLDPEMMASQEGFMPKIAKTLVLPPGKAKEAFVGGSSVHYPQSINPAFIVG